MAVRGVATARRYRERKHATSRSSSEGMTRGGREPSHPAPFLSKSCGQRADQRRWVSRKTIGKTMFQCSVIEQQCHWENFKKIYTWVKVWR